MVAYTQTLIPKGIPKKKGINLYIKKIKFYFKGLKKEERILPGMGDPRDHPRRPNQIGRDVGSLHGPCCSSWWSGWAVWGPVR